MAQRWPFGGPPDPTLKPSTTKNQKSKTPKHPNKENGKKKEGGFRAPRMPQK